LDPWAQWPVVSGKAEYGRKPAHLLVGPAMNPDWIFTITLTLINLVLSAINFHFYLKFRPYSPKALQRANKQWRSNLNYEIGRLMTEQARKLASREKDKTEDGE
jgi:hypothetical protein